MWLNPPTRQYSQLVALRNNDYFGLRLEKDIGCNRSGSLRFRSSLSWLLRRILALSRQRYKQSPRWKTIHNLSLYMNYIHYTDFPIHKEKNRLPKEFRSSFSNEYLFSSGSFFSSGSIFSGRSPLSYPSGDHYDKMGGENWATTDQSLILIESPKLTRKPFFAL